MRALLFAATLLPTAAVACGGFFCNSAAPVTQNAERIVFAPGEAAGTWQMHVQITYGGPPAEFGWLLPVPADVTTGLSSGGLFAYLDARFTPRFRVDDPCFDLSFGAGGAGGGGEGGSGGGGPPGPDVQVISRREVGPYDQVTLRAADADELLEWLNQNDYNAPPNAGGLLQPYLDNGSAFIALKLLPAAGVDDIAPLWLEFTANQPTVPIIPTQVAADPDMGLIVHVLGEQRVVPTNYLHVTINAAAIDWLAGGFNYADVVAAAVDEAGGQAFVTDFAGSVSPAGLDPALPPPFPDSVVNRLASAERVEVLQWLFPNGVPLDLIALIERVQEIPRDVSLRQYLRESERPLDGPAIAEAVRQQLNPTRARVRALFADNRYLTRLFTTMSAHEMTLDPLFDSNPDLPDVEVTRWARVAGGDRDGCGGDRLVFEDGTSIPIEDAFGVVIQRRDGATVRGQDIAAARRIEQTFAAGQPALIGGTAFDEQGTEDDGCGCDVGGDAPGPVVVVGLIALCVLRRRR